VPSKDIEETIQIAKSRFSVQGAAQLPADDQPRPYITSSSEVTEAVIPPKILLDSAKNVTTEDTELFTGEEPISFALTLSREDRVEWVFARLEVFRESIVTYAETCQRERRSSKTVSEAEWQAIIETEGLTRSVPQEQEALKWLLHGES